MMITEDDNIDDTEYDNNDDCQDDNNDKYDAYDDMQPVTFLSSIC